MHFGQFNLMGYRTPGAKAYELYDNAVEQVKAAEANGFDIAWFAEHHFSNYCLCPSPLMMLARLAGETSRIKLGSAVVVDAALRARAPHLRDRHGRRPDARPARARHRQRLSALRVRALRRGPAELGPEAGRDSSRCSSSPSRATPSATTGGTIDCRRRTSPRVRCTA